MSTFTKACRSNMLINALSPDLPYFGKTSEETYLKSERNGANAIIGVDFETSDILQGTATLLSAYGTAVIAKPIEEEE
jgi:hypothetical protein